MATTYNISADQVSNFLQRTGKFPKILIVLLVSVLLLVNGQMYLMLSESTPPLFLACMLSTTSLLSIGVVWGIHLKKRAALSRVAAGFYVKMTEDKIMTDFRVEDGEGGFYAVNNRSAPFVSKIIPLDRISKASMKDGNLVLSVDGDLTSKMVIPQEVTGFEELEKILKNAALQTA